MYSIRPNKDNIQKYDIVNVLTNGEVIVVESNLTLVEAKNKYKEIK